MPWMSKDMCTGCEEWIDVCAVGAISMDVTEYGVSIVDGAERKYRAFPDVARIPPPGAICTQTSRPLKES